MIIIDLFKSCIPSDGFCFQTICLYQPSPQNGEYSLKISVCVGGYKTNK